MYLVLAIEVATEVVGIGVVLEAATVGVGPIVSEAIWVEKCQIELESVFVLVVVVVAEQRHFVVEPA
jgi:hypothetical protein